MTIRVIVTTPATAARVVPVQVTPFPFVVPLDRVLTSNGIATGQRDPSADGARVTIGHGGDLLLSSQWVGSDSGDHL